MCFKLAVISAEPDIIIDPVINVNLDTSPIVIVIAGLFGLIFAIVIAVTIWFRYCCNCCYNLGLQGRGQNLDKKVRIKYSIDFNIIIYLIFYFNIFWSFVFRLLVSSVLLFQVLPTGSKLLYFRINI